MSVTIPFNRDFDPSFGTVEQVTPMIRRVLAENPGAFTFTGTGTYIVGHGKVAVIDPGPDLVSHFEALKAALEGEIVTHILVTHTHRDHSPLSRPLQAFCGAPIYAFGPHGTGREGPEDVVEEGADRAFTPDHRMRDGDAIHGDGWTLTAIHTPGHTSNHLCFALAEEKTLFSGDHVMGWSTTVVSPPDGDMATYMKSLRKLLDRDDVLYWPTHGPAIREPQTFVRSLIAHREEREQEIIACVQDGLRTIPEMVARIYAEVPAYLHPAAARSVLAHLIHLTETARLSTDGPPRPDSLFRLPA
ncbi:MBL fold metallo-hydrolase [Govanella unica]|uniref:MBL fold metallo-hydrolase n=1 Tax=Govanella unica TaxID=2975056 RepID=A0A9X3TWQ2_9PROT|nr:MBL fold metallo-hydrolase [Govania unica]MDA5193138.1 MBL fold metallo-hydrolase [Govania unica]